MKRGGNTVKLAEIETNSALKNIFKMFQLFCLCGFYIQVIW